MELTPTLTDELKHNSNMIMICLSIDTKQKCAQYGEMNLLFSVLQGRSSLVCVERVGIDGKQHSVSQQRQSTDFFSQLLVQLLSKDFALARFSMITIYSNARQGMARQFILMLLLYPQHFTTTLFCHIVCHTNPYKSQDKQGLMSATVH